MLGDSLYLENIQEYVQDEDKIVTYKWLSRKLDVPVNAAKRMLYAYATNCKDNDPINVTYFVSGIVGSNGKSHYEVCLVNESSLEDTKQKFSELFSVHVYSVQKAHLKDANVLFAADYEVTKQHIEDYSKWSTIDCPVTANLSVRKAPASHTPTEVPLSVLPKLSHQIKQEEVEAKSEVEETSKLESKPMAAKKTASKGKLKVQHEKGTMTYLFAKQAQKESSTQKEVEKTKVKVEPSTKSESATTKTTVVHIVSPTKSPHKSPGKRGRPPKSKGPPSKKLTGMFKGLGDSDIEGTDSESEEEPHKTKTASTSKPQKQKQKNVRESAGHVNGGGHQQGDGDSSHRKRKRVQELSSDEEELEEHMAQRTKLDSDANGRKVKRRKRYKKMVTKMYTNEEKEMVTERVYEVVSTDASEEEEEKEEEVKSKPAEPQVKVEKQSPAKQTKQASLRSFFKR